MKKNVSKVESAPDLDVPTAERKVRIKNRYGLHGRPTTAFVKLALQFDSEIRVRRDDDTEEVDGKSAIAILSLGLESGDVLCIKTVGADALEAMAALVDLARNEFVEE